MNIEIRILPNFYWIFTVCIDIKKKLSWWKLIWSVYVNVNRILTSEWLIYSNNWLKMPRIYDSLFPIYDKSGKQMLTCTGSTGSSNIMEGVLWRINVCCCTGVMLWQVWRYETTHNVQLTTYYVILSEYVQIILLFVYILIVLGDPIIKQGWDFINMFKKNLKIPKG